MTPAAAGQYLGALERFLGGTVARQLYGPHVCMAAQPQTPNGSPDELVSSGVDAGAGVTQRWADTIVRSLEQATTEAAIRQMLTTLPALLPLQPFADVVHGRVLSGCLLGALDSQWERDHGVELAPVRFDEREREPHGEIARLWNQRKVLPRPAYDALDAGARRQAFTVAGLARGELLADVHAELGRQLAAGASDREGPNLADFSKFVDKRLTSAGWTPANASHVETIFRTNVMSAYSAGRYAEMRQPAVMQALPYWQIRTVKDSRQRATHRAADGRLLPADHPFWRHAYPPFGYNCRCRVCARSAAWVKATNATIGPPPTGLPDPGFDSGTRQLIQVPDHVLQQASSAPPQPAEVAQPPAPAEPAPPLVQKAGDLVAALKSGDGAQARAILREHIDGLMPPHAKSKDVHDRRAGANTLLANELPASMGADAFHDWNGEMVVSPSIKSSAQLTLRQVAKGGFAKMASVPTTAVDGEKLRALDGLRVLLHEELHGYSRATVYSYGGIGRILEEVGTELNARGAIASLDPALAANEVVKNGGFFPVAGGGRASFGAYYEEIEAVTAVIQRHLGIGVNEAHAVIRKAHADGVCSMGWRFNSRDQHLHAFVGGLDQPQHVAHAIQADLLKLETADAGIGIPSR